MEAIQTYLDNIFAAYPQTSEIQTLKRDMLANMEEKYATLRQSGKSEHEAAYSVIANFGNIEEITAELGLDIKNGEDDANVFVSQGEAQTYLSKAKKNGVMIGIGVWLIIAGVSSVLILDNVFILFLAITLAVSLFIVCGTRMSAYEFFSETPVQLDKDTRNMVESESVGFIPWRTAMIVVGLALILLTVGAYTAIDFPLPLFLNIIGFSVFLFIIAGSYNSAYDVLLGKGDYANKLANKQAARIMSTVASIYWPVVTAIFLIWSFLRDAWGVSWMIWPVSGILFGAICAGIFTWYSTKNKRNSK